MSYEQKDEPNEKKPGGNNPKKNFWTPLIIALALVLLFGWIYNMVSDSQYTETTYADFYTAMENHQLAEVQRRGSRIYYLTKEEAAVESLFVLNIQQFISDLQLDQPNLVMNAVDQAYFDTTVINAKIIENFLMYSKYNYENDNENIIFYDIETKEIYTCINKTTPGE